jgi:hypothetical protein
MIIKNMVDRYSSLENKNRKELLNLLESSPIDKKELIDNLGLFLNTKNFSRILFFYEIYKKFLEVEGCIMEFGVRWGQNLAILTAVRAMFEPYNIKRKIIGFDTFEGFVGTGKQDGKKTFWEAGGLKLPENYETYLNNILEVQEKFNPVSHVKKFEIVKGDASKSLKKYLSKEKQTIVAFAFFDMDIYKPTKDCLEIIKNYVTKGSIIAFDELNCDYAKPITSALKEVFDLKTIEIKRISHISKISYFKV